MHPRAVIAAIVCVPALAMAQPVDDKTEKVDPDEVYARWSDNVRPIKKSYSLPFAESLGLLLATNAGALLAGFDWADISA